MKKRKLRARWVQENRVDSISGHLTCPDVGHAGSRWEEAVPGEAGRWGREAGSSLACAGWGCSALSVRAHPSARPAAASSGPTAAALGKQGRCCFAANAASCHGRNFKRLS